MAGKLMSARQAARELGVSKAYVCRLFSRGVIPAEKVDTDWIVEAKDVRRFSDERAGVPPYYARTEGWGKADCYYLFRVLDKMLGDARGRFDDEIAAIDHRRLNDVARAVLAALGAHERFPNLAPVAHAAPLDPPLVLADYPSMGAFPAFEKYGIIL